MRKSNKQVQDGLKHTLYKLGIKSAQPTLDFNSLFKEVYGDALKDLIYRDNPLLKLIKNETV